MTCDCQWIKCSEWLPAFGELVLVSIRYSPEPNDVGQPMVMRYLPSGEFEEPGGSGTIRLWPDIAAHPEDNGFVDFWMKIPATPPEVTP